MGWLGREYFHTYPLKNPFDSVAPESLTDKNAFNDRGNTLPVNLFLDDDGIPCTEIVLRKMSFLHTWDIYVYIYGNIRRDAT